MKFKRADKIRNDLGLGKDLIDYKDIPKILKYLNITNIFQIFNCKGEIIIEIDNENNEGIFSNMKKNEIITKQIHKLALIAEHYYVIEEISDEENDVDNIYALRYTHMGKYEQVYGKNSGDVLLEKISSLNGVTFSAFNGSRFDFYFILKHIARTAVWH